MRRQSPSQGYLASQSSYASFLPALDGGVIGRDEQENADWVVWLQTKLVHGTTNAIEMNYSPVKQDLQEVHYFLQEGAFFWGTRQSGYFSSK